MEEILNRLAKLVLSEMEKTGQSATCFAELCGINRNELGFIINRRKKDVRLSVIWNICENSNINFSDVFEVECLQKNEIEDFILTNGREKYVLSKVI